VEAERVTFERGGTRYEVPAGGRHHLQDAVLAAAAADTLGIAPEAVARGLASYRPVGMRGAVLRYGDLVVLADCYNANPESLAAAVRWCEEAFADRRRIAVVSTMLELGRRSAAAHAEAARRLVDAGFALVVAMGEFRAAFDALERTGATRVVTADDVSDALDALERELAGGEVVLVKASRGERLERVVEGLAARHAGAEA
jgi:UDP-N-acetylmuramoyl-tripeptide--D-alanyl-D-alanine ligase